MKLQIDHVSISVISICSVQDFYNTIMPILGAKRVDQLSENLKYGIRNDASNCDHSYVTITEGLNSTRPSGNHWCFRVDNRNIVDAFYTQGILSGGLDGGKPGFRSSYHDNYYAAFLIDPCGNKIEAVCHLSYK